MRTFVIAVAGAIAGAGAGVLAGCSSAPTVKPAQAPVAVRIGIIGVALGDTTIDAVGTVHYRRETSLGFTSAGRVAVIAVDEGDRVGRGQLLAALDAATVGATLSSAQAESARAAAELKRSETLFKQGWVTRPRLDNARSAVAAAAATVRAARFQASSARIYASGAGVVLARSVDLNQVVTAGQPIVQIGEAASGMVVRVPLTDRDAARLTIGSPARVTVSALGLGPVTGRVVEIAGRADATTGTFACLIALPADVRLRVGQIGRVAIVAGQAGDARVVAPAAAVFSARAGEGFVYVVDRSSTLRLRKIGLGDLTEDGIAVTTGLNAGERVVVSGGDRLRAGQRVDTLRAPR